MGSAAHALDLRDVPKFFCQYYVSYGRVERQIQQLFGPTRSAIGAAAADGSHKQVALPQLLARGGEASIVKEAQFRDILQDELYKVNQFVLLREQDVTLELQGIAKRISQFSSSSFSGSSLPSSTTATDGGRSRHPTATRSENGKDDTDSTTDAENNKKLSAQFFDDIELEIEEQSCEIVHLDSFIRVNYRAFVDLQREYDKTVGVTTVPWFIASLVKEPFANVDVDRLLILLSLCWERFRNAKEISRKDRKVGSKAETWKPPESFIRNTTKYWVKPKNVVRAKAEVLRHMPYLIFGCSSQDLEVLLDPFILAKDPSRSGAVKAEESQLVSSVYFDSIDAHSYNRRLMRLEGAELVRFRWYGDNAGDANKEIFVERKTHHEGWSGDSSAKERFSLPQKKIFDYMKGKLELDEYVAKKKEMTDSKAKKNILSLGKQIQSDITTFKFQPMVRTSYLRAAFQLATSNEVRFSLDTNLCMVDEYIENNHPNSPWCRVGEEILAKDEVVRFPYAVLEVKLQTAQPDWVSNMLLQCDAVSVYKFSKFQHGMSFLHRNLTERFGLPHWFDEFERRGYVPGFSAPHSPIPTQFSSSAMQPSPLQSTKRDHRLLAPDAHRGGPPPPISSVATGECISGRQRPPRAENPNSSVKCLDSAQRQIIPPRAPPRPPARTRTRPPASSSYHRTTTTPHSASSNYGQMWGRRVSALHDFYPRDRRLTLMHCGSEDLREFEAQIDTPSASAVLPPEAAANDEDLHGRDGGKFLWTKRDTAGRREQPPADFMDGLALIHARGKNIRRLDPKSSFAAERTFLHYVQKGLYLVALATVLAVFGGDGVASRLACMLVAVAADILMVYALVIYLQRVRSINSRVTGQLSELRERIDSPHGPAVVFGVVMALLIATFILNLLGVRTTVKHITTELRAATTDGLQYWLDLVLRENSFGVGAFWFGSP